MLSAGWLYPEQKPLTHLSMQVYTRSMALTSLLTESNVDSDWSGRKCASEDSYNLNLTISYICRHTFDFMQWSERLSSLSSNAHCL